MADATDAAKTRLDRALAELERKVRLRAAPSARTPGDDEDDDLFATIPDDPRRDDRLTELETAAREAADALAEAAEALKAAMPEPAMREAGR